MSSQETVLVDNLVVPDSQADEAEEAEGADKKADTDIDDSLGDEEKWERVVQFNVPEHVHASASASKRKRDHDDTNSLEPLLEDLRQAHDQIRSLQAQNAELVTEKRALTAMNAGMAANRNKLLDGLLNWAAEFERMMSGQMYKFTEEVKRRK